MNATKMRLLNKTPTGINRAALDPKKLGMLYYKILA
jgi:hypothetical protein